LIIKDKMRRNRTTVSKTTVFTVKCFQMLFTIVINAKIESGLLLVLRSSISLADKIRWGFIALTDAAPLIVEPVFS
jgi:hypothetical protein